MMPSPSPGQKVLALVEAELGDETAALLSAALERRDADQDALPGNACTATERDADTTLQ